MTLPPLTDNCPGVIPLIFKLTVIVNGLLYPIGSALALTQYNPDYKTGTLIVRDVYEHVDGVYTVVFLVIWFVNDTAHVPFVGLYNPLPFKVSDPLPVNDVDDKDVKFGDAVSAMYSYSHT